MAIDEIYMKFKKNDHWDSDPVLMTRIILKGTTIEDPELPESEYFYCFFKGNESEMYRGYKDTEGVFRLEGNIPIGKRKALLADPKEKKIEEFENYRVKNKQDTTNILKGNLEEVLK